MTLAYHDGKFVEKSSISIGVNDFGFSRGLAIYEFTRLYGGVPFRLDDHLERLEHAARAFQILCPPREEIHRVVSRLAAENKYPHSTIKFYLTTGECANFPGVGFGSCEGFTPHFMAIEDEVKPLHPEAPKGLDLYRRGISLKTVPFARQMPTVKSINYAPGFIAAHAAAAEGFDEILYTQSDGSITETTMSNIFFVIDGTLTTPKGDMLYGVTRKVLLELAMKFGLPALERDIHLTDMTRATEAFITGSYLEMMPVKKIDAKIFAPTMDAPVFMKLRWMLTDEIAKACCSGG